MGKRETIVAYCRKQLGCAYSYTPSGGKEGSSYNCSFLSTCAYKAAGLTIPRWQGHQNGDGSQLYIGGSAYGSPNTTFDSNIHVQSNHLTGVTLAANQEVAIYVRSHATNYYAYCGQLTIVQTA